ncbi:hypothetical protein J3F83DRAFT_595951 [Trichoderma novae-zelandiae]
MARQCRALVGARRQASSSQLLSELQSASHRPPAHLITVKVCFHGAKRHSVLITSTARRTLSGWKPYSDASSSHCMGLRSRGFPVGVLSRSRRAFAGVFVVSFLQAAAMLKLVFSRFIIKSLPCRIICLQRCSVPRASTPGARKTQDRLTPVLEGDSQATVIITAQDAEDQTGAFHKSWVGALLVNMEFPFSANGDRATSNGLRLSKSLISSRANNFPARFYWTTKRCHGRAGKSLPLRGDISMQCSPIVQTGHRRSMCSVTSGLQPPRGGGCLWQILELGRRLDRCGGAPSTLLNTVHSLITTRSPLYHAVDIVPRRCLGWRSL